MFILDTDHLSLLERIESREGQRIRTRLARISEREVSATIISFEEQMRGWLAHLARAKTIGEQAHSYGKLKRQLDGYKTRNIVEFDERAGGEFERLRRLRLRVGTMDLKIAAIALAHNAVLLTRNAQDFGKIENLQTADWTT